ncbi:FtsQ-type POTRA domain-containing protein [Microbacterium ulmi]|uniref:FtsQ-type POTRA domain-containing protein n=1 Tax=Microbacterium ulmi TaxID=179095 RepID=A0A7Y2Q0M4_9MICO|nr:FtsQ-type POTRA domain-containing protein [Microbacterium ulmi]NII70755.1 cell division protein FtsQ [Microbacterium ulmi]NNH02773.1 FtsQ-type POTRA domain-containing protein [Microbacterium ulmi]
MRRPSPLPPPVGAASRPRADAGTPSEPIAPSEPVEASVAGGAEEASLAPVIPLTHDVDREGPDAASPREPEGDTQVGLRDVWRAARARRKALRAEVRRFTGRQRRRRLTWFASLAALAALVVGTVAAAYSPLFGVERIHVLGTQQLDAEVVAGALDGQLGKPLPLVDESAVKAALVAFPLVETYTLEARPPHELVVRIVERTPIGLVQSAAGYTLVDAAGVALSTTPTPPAGQPLITVDAGTSSPAFVALGQVMRSLPDDIRAQVTEASATTRDDVTLTLGGTRTKVVWGSAEDSAMKALRLQTIMTARPPADVSVYDVSSPSAIVVR